MVTIVRAVSLSVVMTTCAAAALASAAAPPPNPESKSLAATGRIVRYNADRRTLVLKTANGEEQFILASKVRVQESARIIAAESLSGLAGRVAKVRYTVSGTQRSAESVMVSGGADAKPEK